MVQQVQSSDQIILMGKDMLTQLYTMIDTTMSLEVMIDLLAQDMEQVAQDADFRYNLDFEPRSIVGDNYDQLDELGYGNNDVIGTGTDNFHGTHVAGIIAAKREMI